MAESDTITIRADILCGKPTVRGMRISVEQILRAMAAGVPREEILDDFPDLTVNDLEACLSYAADVIEADRVFAIALSS